MKSIFSILMACVMLSAAFVYSVSAAKIVEDSFDIYDENIWSEDAYGVFDGVCEGFGNAVVHQTQYEHDEATGRFVEAKTCPKSFTVGIDLLIEEDTSETPAAGLWFVDTYYSTRGLASDRTVYAFMYDAKESTFALLMNDVNPHFIQSEHPDQQSPIIASWKDDRNLGENMTSGKAINIGLKVEPGKITCYVDGKAVIVAEGKEFSTVGTDPTPILLWNCGAHCIWDNFWLGDLDEYNEAPVIFGDVNGDETVNAKDASALAKRLAGWTIEIDDAAADVNADGTVNAKDLSQLLKFLAGWNVTLGA